jgi:hypothetical protein
MMTKRWWLLGAGVSLLVAACGDDGDEGVPGDGGADAGGDGGGDTTLPDGSGETDGSSVVDLEIPEGCNPLAFEHDCFFPFPSDVFLVADEGTETGRRVAITGAAQVFNDDGKLIDFTTEFPADGFSHHPVINAWFPEGVDTAQFSSWLDDPAPSMEPDHVTVLVDTTDGTLVPHFSELDDRPTSAGRQALYIRPLVRLENERRYVVAIQGLLDPNGAEIEAPRGFMELRDGVLTDAPALEAVRDRYESDVFGVLEAAGVGRAGLTLAWDFSTQSIESATGDMVEARQIGLDYLDGQAPDVEIDEVLEGSAALPDTAEWVARRINGTVEVPLVLTNDQPGGRLTRNAEGAVIQSGTARAEFSILVPRSVWESETVTPTRVVQFGHGFFGSKEEAMGSAQARAADEGGWIVIAGDWWGMSSPDLGVVADSIVESPSNTFDFTDRLHQAMINFMVIGRAVSTALQDAPELQRDGTSVLSDSELYFYGISQGHMLGSVYFAVTPEIDRAVMSVGGGSFTLLMSRASPFGQFLAFIGFKVADELDVQKYIALAPFGMDRIDPLTYVPLTFDSPLDPESDKRMLMNVGIGDSTVPNVGTYVHARSLGLPALTPAGEVPALMETLELGDTSQDISAFLLVDYNIDPRPDLTSRLSSPANCVHGSVRVQPFVIEQMSAFWAPDGVVTFPCGDGACEASCD